jgi:tetratricopeptide (TPR) repeat protein
MPPGNALVLRNRGNALLAQGSVEEALACYDKALAISLDEVITLNNRGSYFRG